jgi:hypothetical protein
MVAAPPKKKSNTVLYVAGGCLGILALGCCGYLVFNFVIAGMLYSTAPEIQNSDVSEVTTDSTDTSASGGGGVCGRAQDCCNAYHEAMGTGGQAGTACIYNTMPAGSDMGCQSAIDGFRAGLSALGRDVPASCQ